MIVVKKDARHGGVLKYDVATGDFFWRCSNGKRKADKEVAKRKGRPPKEKVDDHSFDQSGDE